MSALACICQSTYPDSRIDKHKQTCRYHAGSFRKAVFGNIVENLKARWIQLVSPLKFELRVSKFALELEY